MTTMLSFSSALVAAYILAFVHGSPLLDRAAKFGAVTQLESVNVPRTWSSKGAANSNITMLMQIALKQNNIDGLATKLMDISNPTSANYGKWLSKDELEVYTSPSVETVQTVKSWLSLYDINEDSIFQPTPDAIEIRLPISKMETMLSTKFDMYEESVTGRTVPRTSAYSLPLLLHDHIDTIQPTTAFHRNMGPQVAQNSTSIPLSKRATCDPSNIVPSCIESYYNVDYAGSGRASLGVTGLIGLSASHTDAQSFLSSYDSSVSADFQDISVSDATNDPSNPSLEGNLDTQIALSIGNPNPVSFITIGPTDNSAFGDELVNLGNYLKSTSSPPTSVSTSYGGEEGGFSSGYLDTVCNNFMAAGALGISVFFSSGGMFSSQHCTNKSLTKPLDYGVGGNGETSCSSGFFPLWPASCPYVTSVGATQFVNGGEEAAQFENGGSTGGGFSNYYSIPSYQSDDVSSYLSQLGDTNSGFFNPSGRGYPDVALVGEYYDIVLNGGTEMVYGTSASSPAWASLISLINDYRIGEGKSTLGFLNPLLYASGAARDALNDITTGNNRGCDSNGFPAASGWDPTTGLGSMNFAALRAALG